MTADHADVRHDPTALEALLRDLLEAARTDRDNTLAWWFKAEALVRAVWGAESLQYKALKEIPLLQRYYGVAPGTFSDREFTAAKTAARSYLDALLFEITNFGLGEQPQGV